MTYDINTIFTKYKQLTKKQRQQLLAALQSQGINIVKIEAYEYTDAPGIKHLFFYFAEDSRKAIPYFLLDSEVWKKIKLSIMKDIWDKKHSNLSNKPWKSYSTNQKLAYFLHLEIKVLFALKWMAAKLDLWATG